MDLFKPRTVISIMLYGTFCYLSITGKIGQDAVVAVVAALMTFYYSERKSNGDMGKTIHKSTP